MKHTPTPWSHQRIASHAPQFTIYGRKWNRDIALAAYTENAEANAEFIIKAVNHHDELVAALENLIWAVENEVAPCGRMVGSIKQARALLAKLEEQS